MPPEHDLGKHKTCWGEAGAELVWGLPWLRPPWKNVSGLKLSSNRSHSLTDLTQKNLNQPLVLALAQIQIDLLGKARSRNFDVVPVRARSHPLTIDLEALGNPVVKASA